MHLAQRWIAGIQCLSPGVRVLFSTQGQERSSNCDESGARE
ncbi:hypothetical protein AM1_3685 [Acaryochloris marina MBIC11017]|uniref:Uncharacterized protein n=1 Tax=Acaryochloris marina (strain MBIC 11017) TaxID=329726 RepID=B0C4D1_ACAM1|nr:hypothetical protein AM1_3685 [Acaryochloris marina MBIC11017]